MHSLGMNELFNNKRTLHIIFRLWAVVILIFIVYHAYELGYTDKYKPLDMSHMGCDKLRFYYVNTGIEALKHLNFVNICVATSFLIAPLVLFVFLFRPQLMTVNKTGIALGYASLFFLTIYNVLAVDIIFNYYASRYFLPALFPVLFLTFCSILLNIRSKVIFMTIVAALCIVMVTFNIRHDYALFKNRAYPNRFSVIREIGKYIPPRSYVFLQVPSYLRFLLLPNLRFVDDLNVISLRISDEGKLDQAQLMRQIFSDYAMELDLADFYLISNNPYAYNVDATVTFEDALLPVTIAYPQTINKAVYNLYVYHVQGFGNYLFNTMKILNLAKYSDLDIRGYSVDGVWSTGNIEIKNLKYRIEPDDTYIVLNTSGKYQIISRQYHIPEAVVSLTVNGKAAKMVKKTSTGSYYFKLDKNVREIISLTVRSSTFIPKKVGINDDDRVLGIDARNFTIE